MKKAIRTTRVTFVMSVILLLSVLLSISLVGATPGGSSADNRVSTFINLARGESANNTVKLTDLTADDIRFLGIYLSNYYAPFAQELNGASGKLTKDTIVKVLKEDFKFTDKDADYLATAVVSMSSADGNISGLTWWFGKEAGAATTTGLYQAKYTPTSYFELQKIISGGYGQYSREFDRDGHYCAGQTGKKLRDCWSSSYDTAVAGLQGVDAKATGGDKVDADVRKVWKDGYYYAYLADSHGHIVFSADMSLETITPSVHALLTGVASSAEDSGLGTALFDVNKDDLKSIMSSSSGDLEGNSIFATGTLKVDTFGNIMVHNKTRKYVIMPAASNPYVWKPADAAGKAGSYVQPMSAAYLLQSGGTFSFGAAGSHTCTLNSEPVVSRAKYKAINDLGSHALIRAYAYRGSAASNNSALMENTKRVQEMFSAMANNAEAANKKGTGFYDSYNQAARMVTFQQQLRVFTDILSSTDMYYFGGDLRYVPSGSSNCFTNMVVPDVLQAHKDSNGLLNVADVSSSTDAYSKKSADSSFNTGDAYFTSGLTNVMSTNTAQMFYVTYLYAYFGSAETQAKLGYGVNKENLLEPIALSDIQLASDVGDTQRTEDQMLNDIKTWTWYLLNPTQGFNYANLLIKNKLGSFVVDTHNDVVGASNAPAVAGSTHYTGFSGYVTMPKFTDLPWTDKLYKLYQDNYIYVVLLIVAIMAVYAVTGVLTVQRALAGVVIFGVLAWVPLPLLNASVDASNSISNNIYGQKFTYWALVQSQSYSKMIDDAAQQESYQNYIEKQWAATNGLNFSGKANNGNNKGTDAVILKWQSPKKLQSGNFGTGGLDAELAKMVGCSDTTASATGVASAAPTASASPTAGDSASTGAQCTSMAKFANKQLQGAVSGEQYLASKNSMYLYRSYVDINNYSRYIYDGIGGSSAKYQLIDPDTSNWPTGLKASWKGLETNYSDSETAGYSYTSDAKSSAKEQVHIMAPMSSRIYSDAIKQVDDVKKVTEDQTLGIDPRSFKFGIPSFTKGTAPTEAIKNNLQVGNYSDDYKNFDATQGGKYSDEDYAALAANALMSESPYYYYSWLLYDQGMSPSSGATEGYKNLILSGDGRKYFYNVDGNGELRDYLDMRSLFTYTIPYLKAGNDVVSEYDKLYGLTYNEGIPTEPGHDNDPEIKNDPVAKQKYWENLNTARLFGMYSAWVDQLYDSSYAKPQTINHLGTAITIQNPLDPSSYPEDRPMVFSKSEQYDYGIKDGDLTTVEKKIQEVQKNSIQPMYFLLNSYNFNDSVLNSAAAIEITFEFNKTFSDGGFLHEGAELYPSSYELKNFSYDAYLRLILANSTGDEVTSTSGSQFYNNIIGNSNFLTGFMMLIVDVVSSYVLPFMKLALLIGIALLMVLKVFAMAIQVQDGKSLWAGTWSGIIKPALMTFLLFTGMAWVISLFLSNGNTAVTGYDGLTISLGEPFTVLVAMLIINLSVVFLGLKIILSVWRELRSSIKTIGGSVAGVLQGTVAMAKGLAGGKGFSTLRAATAGGVVAGVPGAVAGAMISKRAMERAANGGASLGGLAAKEAEDRLGGVRGRKEREALQKNSKPKKDRKLTDAERDEINRLARAQYGKGNVSGFVSDVAKGAVSTYAGSAAKKYGEGTGAGIKARSEARKAARNKKSNP